MSNSQKKKCVLLVDDNLDLLVTTQEVLEDPEFNYKVITLSNSTKIREVLEENQDRIDVVVTDLQMPMKSGEEVLDEVSDFDVNLPVIVFTGEGNKQKNHLIAAGAKGFVDKADSVHIALPNAIEIALSSKRKVKGRGRKFIYRDEKMKQVLDMVTKLAAVPSPVLIEGEPGTGKELIAYKVHNQRLKHLRRAGDQVSEKMHPYVAVNCGALSKTLLESQLFGHKKGAFTGSVADQDGVFVAAKRGTLFLDEITELDLDLQVKLLRALQEREVTPVGATKAIPIHARVVTATNRPIQQLVNEGKFRADLYYRINVVSLKVPPLRDRIGDIQPMAEAFLRDFAEEYNCEPRQLTEPARVALESYQWPGNVRELHNCIERSFALGGNASEIRVEDFPPEISLRFASEHSSDDAELLSSFQEATQRTTEALVEGRSLTATASHFKTYDELVAEHIREALNRSRGVKSRAATMLSIDRNRLYRLIEKYQIST
ncbi:MAG: response regulator [Planctomycetia bacterium]|nr:response regulator [Planctomycetia bacterium]